VETDGYSYKNMDLAASFEMIEDTCIVHLQMEEIYVMIAVVEVMK
jgi:hypothetical protein